MSDPRLTSEALSLRTFVNALREVLGLAALYVEGKDKKYVPADERDMRCGLPVYQWPSAGLTRGPDP